MRKDLSTFGGEPVISPSPFARFLYPSSGDEPLLLQAAEDRIERSNPKLNALSGMNLDQLSDFVPMSRLCLEKREDKELGAAFFEFSIQLC